DAIDISGGFVEAASSVEVARRKFGPEYNDTTSVVFKFPLDAAQNLEVQAQAFVLEPDDHVMVRAAPGFRSQRFATVEGLFVTPGAYALTENRDRLRDVIARAGGTLPTAYDKSFRLSRGGRLVAIEYSRALRGGRTDNVLLQAGDVISIGPDPRTVAVLGAVQREALLVYRPGLTTRQYVEMAGGPSEKGNVKRAVVDYPTGFSRRVRSFLGLVYVDPGVLSGSVITVPERPESKLDANEIWARVLTATSAFASIAIAWAALKN
ncbi:MAG: SLBB domain-containing protein, partial [Gemmatimonadaceae bacterium]|nr:SLBB domain-containing protein [Gemmatimonadaceae bacterium]